MNKKYNKILVVCLALLLALSVGYALFSETITINGTATAKGSFSMTTDCQGGYSDDLINAGLYSSTNENQGGYSSDVCTPNGTKVSFQTTLDSPGSRRDFTVKITNSGTIDATLDFEKTNYSMFMNESVRVCPLLENGEESTQCTEQLIFFEQVEDVDGNLVTRETTGGKGFQTAAVALEIDGEVCDLLAGDCGDLNALKPGDSIYYVISSWWPNNYHSGYDNGYKSTYSVEIPFIQTTAQ